MKSKKSILSIALLLLFLSVADLAVAQSATARKETRKGNKEYK
jgi:hypothetical protein